MISMISNDIWPVKYSFQQCGILGDIRGPLVYPDKPGKVLHACAAIFPKFWICNGLQ